jgi:hypothetical protein
MKEKIFGNKKCRGSGITNFSINILFMNTAKNSWHGNPPIEKGQKRRGIGGRKV